MLKINLFIFFWLFAGMVMNSPPTNIAVIMSEPTSESNSIILPLKKAGNLILVDAKVDGVQGTFVFDSGAQGIVLNATYFRDSKKTFDTHSAGISTKKIKKQTKKISRFELGGHVFENIKADVINLGHLENSRNIKIHGLIGAILIKDFETTIDIRNLQMTMRPIDRKGNLIEQFNDTTRYDTQQKIRYANNIIVTTIPINGKDVCFCLDTGAEHNVIDFHNHNKIMETISVTSRKVLRGAGEEKIEVLFGVMNQFFIEETQFEPMQTLITDMTSLRNSYGINVYGMLGFDFFNQCIIKMNFKKKTMHIALYK
jgi:predicted aspartyl protease